MGPTLKSLTLKNILSFGPDTPPLELGPLNVFIGPNASGKSNVIDALSILRATPRDVQEAVRKLGGWDELTRAGGRPEDTLDIQITAEFQARHEVLRHSIAPEVGGVAASGEHSLGEWVVSLDTRDHAHVEPVFGSDHHGRLVAQHRDGEVQLAEVGEGCVPEDSALAQLRDPLRFPQLRALTVAYGGMRVYRGFDVRRGAELRRGQRADEVRGVLADDAANLALVLNRLYNSPARASIDEAMRRFWSRFDGLAFDIGDNYVRLALRQRGIESALPATRLSDGTMAFLALLAILLNPEPGSVICIEEPETCLHPDAIVLLAELLVKASENAQFIVTTQSDILVDALSERPECVVVFDSGPNGTVFKRLDREELKGWLERYSLGELWLRGGLGGTRW